MIWKKYVQNICPFFFWVCFFFVRLFYAIFKGKARVMQSLDLTHFIHFQMPGTCTMDPWWMFDGNDWGWFFIDYIYIYHTYISYITIYHIYISYIIEMETQGKESRLAFQLWRIMENKENSEKLPSKSIHQTNQKRDGKKPGANPA